MSLRYPRLRCCDLDLPDGEINEDVEADNSKLPRFDRNSRFSMTEPGPYSFRSSSGILGSFIDWRTACHLILLPIYILLGWWLIVIVSLWTYLCIIVRGLWAAIQYANPISWWKPASLVHAQERSSSGSWEGHVLMAQRG